MLKRKHLLTLEFFFAFLLLSQGLYSQKGTSSFIVDSLSQTIQSSLPFNSPLTLLIPIETKEVDQIYLIEKYKYFDLAATIMHYTRRSRNYIPETIAKKFYDVKHQNNKDTLVIHFRDELLLKPSTSYFLIVAQKKLAPSAFNFFDNYYKYKLNLDPKSLNAAQKSLTTFDKSMHDIFGSNELNFSWYSPSDFSNDVAGLFDKSFTGLLIPHFNNFYTANQNLSSFVSTQSARISTEFPGLDSLSYVLLIRDTMINREALGYLVRQDFYLNDIASDIYLSPKQRNIQSISGGLRKIGCLSCDLTEEKNYTGRIANLEQSIIYLNNLFKSLHLIRPKFTSTNSIENSMRKVDNWISVLESSRDSLKNITKIQSAIEKTVLDEKFPYKIENGDTLYKDFLYSSIVAGNSLLNFETRNKVLLTPDFGIVSSAWNKQGKVIDYGIVPYLGFHINFMGVDKDVTYKTYKKNWKQKISFMVGWSLVNLSRDSTYSNFFEKSSLLTGFGFRLSNAVRIVGGTQWLFRDFPDTPEKNRKMLSLPYVGISLDLNIKEYLNGFVEVLSGIGKTTNKTKAKTEITN